MECWWRCTSSLLLEEVEEGVVHDDLFAEERGVHTVEEVEELCAYGLDAAALARHLAIDAGLLVVGDEGFGLLVIGDDAVGDGLVAGVVGASLDGGAVFEALADGGVGDHDGDDGVDLLAPLGQQMVEVLGLLHGAGEAVEQEARHALRGVEQVFNHALDDIVGHQVAGLDEVLGHFAQLGAGSNLTAQQFAGADVFQVVLRSDGTCVRAFAGPRRAKENVKLHTVRLLLLGIMVFVFPAAKIHVSNEAGVISLHRNNKKEISFREIGIFRRQRAQPATSGLQNDSFFGLTFNEVWGLTFNEVLV